MQLWRKWHWLNWYMALWCVQNMHRDRSSFTRHRLCNNQRAQEPLLWFVRMLRVELQSLIQKSLATTAQRVCSEADNSAIVAIVKCLWLISRWGTWQMFIKKKKWNKNDDLKMSCLSLDLMLATYNIKRKNEDVPLVEFIYLVFTHMPGESYCRQRGSLLLYLCYVFRALINSLCWFYKVKGMKICSVIRFDACCVHSQRGSEQPLHMVARLLQKTGLPITSAICHYQKAWGTYHCLARQKSQFKSTSWVWKIITICKFPSCVSSCAYLDTCAYYIS